MPPMQRRAKSTEGFVGGLDDYTVPLMDMFFFAYDKVEEGYVDLDEEEQADLGCSL